MKATFGALLTAGMVHAAWAGLADGGFEATSSIPSPWPTSFNVWAGNYSQVTTTALGIQPRDGGKMLQFLACGNTVDASRASGCEVIQLVDCSAFLSLIATGGAWASASAWFNRVSGNAQTDTEFDVRIAAVNGPVANFPNLYPLTFLAIARVKMFSDGDPGTWEPAGVVLHLPTNTTYLAVGLQAIENVYNNNTGQNTEFDGHFADSVTLSIGPSSGVGQDVSIYHAVELAWPSVTSAVYQVQWASALDTNTWTNLGGLVVGDGTTNSVFDSTRSQPKRFYRVLKF